MRTFGQGNGEKRKTVILELDGFSLRVTKGDPDGTTRVSEHSYSSTDRARFACEKAASDLLAHGYVERGPAAGAPVEVARVEVTRAKARPSRGDRSKSSPRKSGGLALALLAEGEVVEEVAGLPPRPDSAAGAVKKQVAKKKRKKKRNQAGSGDELDRRVIAGIVGFGLLCVGTVGFLAYEAFLRPPSIVGHWEGSRTEHEIGKFLTNTQHRLILDARKNASMAIQGNDVGSGTYEFRGNRLRLSLKDPEGEPDEIEYQVKLGGATLDLFDPMTGKKVVQLIRFHEPSRPGAGTPPPAAPKEIAAGPVDKGADEKLASVPFSAKDGAFRLRHPEGWEADTGARPDNTYSWAKFAKGSARVRIYADIAGSLTSGPNSSDYEEGSELAPVHGAHIRYKKDATELYNKYEESPPVAFKGAGLGEGRISTFTSSGEGLLGSKLKGIRVTLLTNDRRVSILCDAPAKLFDAILPTFLATCRSVSR